MYKKTSLSLFSRLASQLVSCPKTLDRKWILGIAILTALMPLRVPEAMAAFAHIEVQDWDKEGSPDDLAGPQLFTDNALFTTYTSIGGLGPSGTGGGGFNYMGQTTEWANYLGENSPSIKSYARSFKIPKTYNGFGVTKATLLYDFVFLTDDLNDLGLKQSDLEDDDYFRVHIDGVDVLKVDSDQVFLGGTVPGLVPPNINALPTGFEKRTGTVAKHWLTSSHNLTAKIGKKVDLGFDVVDPVLINPVGESLESGMMIDEVRLLLFYDNNPSTASADFDQSGTVDQTDLLVFQESYGVGFEGDADFDDDVDGNDFLSWQNQQASTPPLSAGITAVPEPNTMLLLLACTSISTCLARKWYHDG
jgi:hypothetical protein